MRCRWILGEGLDDRRWTILPSSSPTASTSEISALRSRNASSEAPSPASLGGRRPSPCSSPVTYDLVLDIILSIR